MIGLKRKKGKKKESKESCCLGPLDRTGGSNELLQSDSAVPVSGFAHLIRVLAHSITFHMHSQSILGALMLLERSSRKTLSGLLFTLRKE